MQIHFYMNEAKSAAVTRRAELAECACRVGLTVSERSSADIVISLGGDGTLLRAVHECPNVPVLGFNLGGLGYLAGVAERDFASALAALASGSYRVSERRMVMACGHVALNDIVLSLVQSGRSALLDLEADGKHVTEYMADGLIFSTPTGSTAYSLAAGGPVLMPDSKSFVVTPLNPHALGVRPLVVSDTVEFRVTVRPRTSGNDFRVGVYADGENVRTLAAGESVAIVRSPTVAKLVELEGYDPYDVLAHKLGWSGSNVK